MSYYHYMNERKSKPNLSIRMSPEVLHQARIAAVTAKKTLGVWLEEAIAEKIKREHKGQQKDKGG